VLAHDKENARVQLRVLATGRVAASRMPGKKGDPTWFATRRLTKVVGDVTKPQGSWLCALDRNALSSTVRATQVELDTKESKFRELLRAHESRVASQDARNVKFVERRIVDVVALRQTPAGPIVTVILQTVALLRCMARNIRTFWAWRHACIQKCNECAHTMLQIWCASHRDHIVESVWAPRCFAEAEMSPSSGSSCNTVTFLIFGLVRKKSRPKKTGRIR
jgi:hypothetical protein